MKIGFGSDLLGQLQTDHCTEFTIRAEAMRPQDIIRSATLVNAEIVRAEGKLGELIPGAYADLLVVDGDPVSRYRRVPQRRQQPERHHVARPVREERNVRPTSDTLTLPSSCPCRRASMRPRGLRGQPLDSRLRGNDGGWVGLSATWYDAVSLVTTSSAATPRLPVLQRVALDLLVFIGAALIGVPLALTLYLSVFDEKLILFPPRGYTLSWYPAIIPQFRRPAADQPGTGSAGGGRQPAARRARRHRAVALPLPRPAAIAALLLAPITVPGIALGLAIYVSWC